MCTEGPAVSVQKSTAVKMREGLENGVGISKVAAPSTIVSLRRAGRSSSGRLYGIISLALERSQPAWLRSKERCKGRDNLAIRPGVGPSDRRAHPRCSGHTRGWSDQMRTCPSAQYLVLTCESSALGRDRPGSLVAGSRCKTGSRPAVSTCGCVGVNGEWGGTM